MTTREVCGCLTDQVIVSRRPLDDKPGPWRPILVCTDRDACLRRAEKRTFRTLNPEGATR